MKKTLLESTYSRLMRNEPPTVGPSVWYRLRFWFGAVAFYLWCINTSGCLDHLIERF